LIKKNFFFFYLQKEKESRIIGQVSVSQNVGRIASLKKSGEIIPFLVKFTGFEMASENWVLQLLQK
jgi:hypothetical protein